MRQVVTGSARYELLSTAGTTATGAGSWIKLKDSYTKFSLQAAKRTTGTTAYTILLQGTLTTLSTALRTLISYTAADNGTVKFSTGSIPPVSMLRYNITVLAGTSGATKPSIRYIYAAWSP